MIEPGNESFKSNILKWSPFLNVFLRMRDPANNTDEWTREFIERGNTITEDIKEKFNPNHYIGTLVPLTLAACEQNIYDGSQIDKAVGTTSALVNIGYELGDMSLAEMFIVDIAESLRGAAPLNVSTLVRNPEILVNHIIGMLKVGVFLKRNANSFRTEGNDNPFKDFINGLDLGN